MYLLMLLKYVLKKCIHFSFNKNIFKKRILENYIYKDFTVNIHIQWLIISLHKQFWKCVFSFNFFNLPKYAFICNNKMYTILKIIS